MIAVGMYTDMFAFKLFIFLYLLFRETFEFPKK